MKTTLLKIICLAISLHLHTQTPLDYYSDIQKNQKTPIASDIFRKAEALAYSDYNDVNHYKTLSDYFSNTTEKVWSIVYAETYCNLAPNPSTSNRLSKRIVELIQASLKKESNQLAISLTNTIESSEESIKAGRLPFESNFELSLLVAIATSDVECFPLSLSSLHTIRNAQLEIWLQKGLPKNDYIEHLLSLKSSGNFETYNYLLFADLFPNEFAIWKKNHPSVTSDFAKFTERFPFKLKSNNFHRIHTINATAPPALPGYASWHFGMSREEVRSIPEFGPYYDFKNADIGTQNGPFNNAKAPTSFYFNNDKLDRVMILLYNGPDYNQAKNAWEAAYTHLNQQFGGVEVSTNSGKHSDLSAAISALDASGFLISPSGKIQMGAIPMPKDKQVWCSFRKINNETYFVAVNYAKP